MTTRIITGDCREAMAAMEPNSVDAIVTDPPYGLSFMGKGWDHGVPGIAFWAEAFCVLKPGGHLVAFGGTRTSHRMVCAIEDAGFEIRDSLVWMYSSGFPKSHNLSGEWKGWGTALKPAHEPICLARRPLIGTVARNVAEHGTGGLNIDGCRIGGPDGHGGGRKASGGFVNGYEADGFVADPVGRWPANVVLDENAARALDEAVGERKVSGSAKNGRPATGDYGGGFGGWAGKHQGPLHNDTGGPSRFFYVAKASRAERNFGLDGMPERERGNVSQYMTGTTSNWINDPRHPDGGYEMAPAKPARNHHPTVKPVTLMRWLCRLVTPPGGLVLDPFAGSGSTGIAASREGFGFIGIELDPEYADIARRRIAGDAPLFALEVAS